MIINKNDLILDTNSLIGTHRLIASIEDKSFNKIILPPDALALAWPPERFMLEYLIETGKKDKLDILKREKDDVFELVEELNNLGRLEMLDHNEWYDNSHVYKNYNDIHLYLTKMNHKSHIESIDTGLIPSDISAMTMAWVKDTPICTFNPVAKAFIHQHLKTYEERKEIITIPSELKKTDIESFIDKNTTYQKTQKYTTKISRVYSKIENPLEKIISNIALDTVFSFIPGASLIHDVYTEITEGIHQYKEVEENNKFKEVLGLYTEDTSCKKVKLIEDLMKYGESK